MFEFEEKMKISIFFHFFILFIGIGHIHSSIWWWWWIKHFILCLCVQQQKVINNNKKKTKKEKSIKFLLQKKTTRKKIERKKNVDYRYTPFSFTPLFLNIIIIIMEIWIHHDDYNCTLHTHTHTKEEGRYVCLNGWWMNE